LRAKERAKRESKRLRCLSMPFAVLRYACTPREKESTRARVREQDRMIEREGGAEMRYATRRYACTAAV